MKTLKALFHYNWQSLVSLILAVTVFKLGGAALVMVEPTAGTNDLGIMHTLVFALGAVLVAIAVAFGCVAIAFPTIDGYIDAGTFAEDWRQLRPAQRVAFCFIALGMLAMGFAYFTHLAAGG